MSPNFRDLTRDRKTTDRRQTDRRDDRFRSLSHCKCASLITDRFAGGVSDRVCRAGGQQLLHGVRRRPHASYRQRAGLGDRLRPGRRRRRPRLVRAARDRRRQEDVSGSRDHADRETDGRCGRHRVLRVDGVVSAIHRVWVTFSVHSFHHTSLSFALQTSSPPT